MPKQNMLRKNCRDVFNAFLVAVARYAGLYEFPVIQPTFELPKRLISFSKAISTRDCNCWVHFYEDDCEFERIWRNPRRYLPILQRFEGVILPDFSVYRDMPFVMQLWNIYRSRAIGFWLQQQSIKVIVNVRYGDSRTYRLCCDGAPHHCVIAVGSLGEFDDDEDRHYFVEGLRVIADILKPCAIVVYGSVNDPVFDDLRSMGISIVAFECELALSRKVDE